MSRLCVLSGVLALCALLLLESDRAKAFGDGTPTVGSLTRAATNVVVGEITVLDHSGQTEHYRLTVHRSLKGLLSAGSTIQVTGYFLGGGECISGEAGDEAYGIWFLSRAADGTYIMGREPVQQTCLPLSNEFEGTEGDIPVMFSYTSDAAPADKLAYEIAWTAESTAGVGPIAFRNNFSIFDGSSQAARARIYHSFFGSSAQPLRLSGLLGLTSLADSSALDLLERDPNMVAALMPSSSNEPDPVFTAPLLLLNALRKSGVSDNRAVSIATRVLSDTNLSLMDRQRAGELLQSIHTRAAAEVMAPYLVDQDITLRSLAVGTLACLANAVPVPTVTNPRPPLDVNSPGPFKTEATLDHFVMGTITYEPKESYYLSFWKQWWLDNRQSVQATGASAK